MSKLSTIFYGNQGSRTKNTIYNFISGIGGQLITVILHFVVRTAFIHTLGKSYLGIGGLFSNILTMLSLAELGVGNAIIFKLYKPLAENDQHRVTLLIKFYKQVYRAIGMIVLLLGLLLIPFLPHLIKGYDKLETLGINAVLIFLLYLSKSVSSYLFFAYKSAVIKANQQVYLLNLIEYFFSIGLAVAQIFVLFFYPHFEFYVALGIFEIIVKNMIWARLADKKFPYINEKTPDRISKAEVKEIFKDCEALLIYKMNGVVLKATDNIVISTFLGIEWVSLYSNYYIFYTTLQTLFSRIFGAVAHSLGNLHAVDRSKHEYEVFRVVTLIAFILGGTASVGIAVCSDELINVWIGQDWMIAWPFSLLLGIEVFTLAIRHALSRYRNSMGLFQQAKFRPLLGMIINLVVSVWLVNYWGICGVLVGTIAADWLTVMWYDPLIIHKHGFKTPELSGIYFLRLAKSIIVIVLIGVADHLICSHFATGMGWFSVLIHVVICGVTVPAMLLAAFSGSYEGKYLVGMITKVVRKITKRKGRN